MPKRLTALGFAFRRFAVPGRVGARVFGLNIGCRYSTSVRKRPLHPTRSQFKPEASQTQAPVTPATEPERRAGGGLTTPGYRRPKMIFCKTKPIRRKPLTRSPVRPLSPTRRRPHRATRPCSEAPRRPLSHIPQAPGARSARFGYAPKARGAVAPSEPPCGPGADPRALPRGACGSPGGGIASARRRNGRRQVKGASDGEDRRGARERAFLPVREQPGAHGPRHQHQARHRAGADYGRGAARSASARPITDRIPPPWRR